MPRSQVLTGRIEQRDRAQLRGRLDRRRARSWNAPDARDQLASWLSAHATADEVAPLEALDLTAYLRDTGNIELPPEERLRELAIFLEPRLTWRDEQPRAWLAHDRIYQAALQLNPRDPSVHLSRAASAHEHAEGLCRAERQAWVQSPVRRRMMRVAHEAANEAVALAPDDSDALQRVGDLCYHDPDRGPAAALPWYQRALERDPTNAWAALYRAHCLHDLGRWREAAEAYDAVTPTVLVGQSAWRYEHLLEQRADCWLRAGETERARQEFEALLERWEKSPDLASQAWGRHLAEAARGVLRSAIGSRARQLFEREENARAAGRATSGGFGLELSMLGADP